MNLYFKKYGNGIPLVLIHGLFGNSDNWMLFSKNISERLPVAVYSLDLRNHGRSGHHPVFSMEALIDDLAEFLDTNNIENPILMGHSLGGKIILNYLKEPVSKDVKSVIIADMGMRSHEMKYHHVELLYMMKNTPLESFSDRKEIENYFSEKIPSQRLAQFVLKNIKRNAENTFSWKINLEAIDLYLDRLIGKVDYDSPHQVPALFLKGAESDYINEEDRQIISENFLNSEIVEIPKAGHWLHSENPIDFENEIFEFLEKKISIITQG
ncbi:MAG: alpha/beta fold hydrolase [Bacteroidales bacterium]|nr:alpha/beta fold hydrolase [Bacteroidales bacterium]